MTTIGGLTTMPGPTTAALPFMRKTQKIKNLETERPKSLDHFRNIVEEAMTVVEQQVQELERAYYGNTMNIEEEISRFVPHIQAVLAQTRVPSIPQISAVEKVIHRALDPQWNIDSPVDKTSFSQFRECYNKIREYVPKKFSYILDNMNKILELMNKYCDSFYTGTMERRKVSRQLETAFHYESKRRDFYKACKINLDDVLVKSDRFFVEGGIHIMNFTLNATDLARKCNCLTLPFLLLFPECCERIRNTIAGIKKWIIEDATYASFIESDIVNAESKKAPLLKQLRDKQIKTGQVEQRLKALYRECDSLEVEIKQLRKRELQFIDEEIVLEKEVRLAKYDLTTKEEERDGHKKAKEVFEPHVFEAELAKLASEVVGFREVYWDVEKRYNDLKKKQEWLYEKKTRLQTNKQLIKELTEELKRCKQDNIKIQIDIVVIKETLNMLQHILACKNSGTAVKKLFHNMPVIAKRPMELKKLKGPVAASLPPERKDPLDVAITKVTKTIEGDWQKLYRFLPFYPPRGEETIQGDIDDILTKHFTTPLKEQAKQSLLRWKRMNSKANVIDLRTALQEIRRHDVVKSMERRKSKTHHEQSNKNILKHKR
ncbi:unnamed protein product [Owenia fusiformis]|uniref:Uncharacterized protein n=1 Tax=Owenia fusiformis TaxID=6347 RepID=A0A8J1Y4W8_OWEFU|nr:unnamed protein product [Owenia fusiformis]